MTSKWVLLEIKGCWILIYQLYSHACEEAQRLTRVFKINVETCPKCAGKVNVIASIEDPNVIKKILNHLGVDSREAEGLRHQKEMVDCSLEEAQSQLSKMSAESEKSSETFSTSVYLLYQNSKFE